MLTLRVPHVPWVGRELAGVPWHGTADGVTGELALPGGVDDRSDQQAGVALVDAGAGVAEAAGDVAGEAGSEAEHPLLPPEPGRVPASSAAIAASQSIAAREVAAFGPGLVGDDQPGAGFERVEAVSAGTERAPAVVLADPAMRAAELHPVKVVAAMMRGAG